MNVYGRDGPYGTLVKLSADSVSTCQIGERMGFVVILDKVSHHLTELLILPDLDEDDESQTEAITKTWKHSGNACPSTTETECQWRHGTCCEHKRRWWDGDPCPLAVLAGDATAPPKL